ncbi:hydrogenase formation protein HypD [Candidatus Desantisbacteria bacterium CG2_30_40_21]|uniref:Hydrogenase formation protein HypD n=5 Tax=unclassified Candidatus Desantisiibacteriota TaxID=3106372 RepID=A0A2M7JBZ3_9BACT|nr:MAG: hydrogenase formation protein HypD [Candidatus Desantisbacteria bacterium CG2_30_40_21]PIP41479.1 MAG: hydrogenase formation protein HypD [Candidatus Desantisbacteria bacterium CG23_combo_of_CG06-09_8_20_14_all_40_23]PIX16873.1 MAG: hydrogenase formation protein HypD [Candidatus Desantisbacteria bacterium CG_4_8_14_3_um_filter_40_12]PIY19366.1 MAG: hydrogenase formation protein HypD [Candidatus Desantisbacteria bacterium CG_4_10_14_3_um_filter_40_18]PJB29183.1 MAG: hydrogenase formation
MRYIDEFCDPGLAKRLVESINRLSDKEIVLMEVCGTHTMAIFKHGIKKLLAPSIRLVSGPGCPVCVTAAQDIDVARWISRQKDVIFTTFGDMIRVPGGASSLERQKGQEGADIRVVYSILDALDIARNNPTKRVVFFGIGFETTAPSIASGIQLASKQGLDNFFVYSCHKLIPPAMKALLESGEVKIDGFICPGHVSTIIGAKPYEFIAEQYHIPCVITGFEPLDILQAILMLVKARESGQVGVEIQYTRAVKHEGNVVAQRILAEVFEPIDAVWRGIGVIPDSGLKIRQEYSRFDALLQFEMPEMSDKSDLSNLSDCICGLILRGIAIPTDCPLFKTVCNTENPVGACMVSLEGTCAAYYKYSP